MASGTPIFVRLNLHLTFLERVKVLFGQQVMVEVTASLDDKFRPTMVSQRVMVARKPNKRAATIGKGIVGSGHTVS